MAWSSAKKQGQLYLYLFTTRLRYSGCIPHT